MEVWNPIAIGLEAVTRGFSFPFLRRKKEKVSSVELKYPNNSSSTKTVFSF